jgi:hypothetical protein
MPDVLAHNVETVRSLQWIRDGRASFDRSLAVLREAKSLGAGLTKSSLLLGLGEREGEVLSAMDELRSAGTDILVMGQYLRPTKKQYPVAEYLHPDRFARYAEEARSRGFSSVIASPLARTSYHAREGHAEACSDGESGAACASGSAADTALLNGRAREGHAEACSGEESGAACASGSAADTVLLNGRAREGHAEACPEKRADAR